MKLGRYVAIGLIAVSVSVGGATAANASSYPASMYDGVHVCTGQHYSHSVTIQRIVHGLAHLANQGRHA